MTECMDDRHLGTRISACILFIYNPCQEIEELSQLVSTLLLELLLVLLLSEEVSAATWPHQTIMMMVLDAPFSAFALPTYVSILSNSLSLHGVSTPAEGGSLMTRLGTSKRAGRLICWGPRARLGSRAPSSAKDRHTSICKCFVQSGRR